MNEIRAEKGWKQGGGLEMEAMGILRLSGELYGFGFGQRKKKKDW